MAELRIVSLLPSATEMVSALGFADCLVGVSHRCAWPPEVTELPRVTRSPLTTERTAAEIAATVRQMRESGRRLYEIDEPLLRSLEPDLILTQDVCEVCAVPAEQAEAAACMVAPGARVVTLQARRLEEILANLRMLGEALGDGARAARLLQRMEQRLAAIDRAVSESGRARPGVFAVEWLDPLKCTGGWLPDLIERAGGQNLIGQSGAKVRAVDWAEVVAVAPEVLLIMPCGWPLDKIREQARSLSGHPGWHDLPAVRSGRVYLVDGTICSKHGPRVVDAIELLASLLHPDAVRSEIAAELACSWQQAYGEAP